MSMHSDTTTGPTKSRCTRRSASESVRFATVDTGLTRRSANDLYKYLPILSPSRLTIVFPFGLYCRKFIKEGETIMVVQSLPGSDTITGLSPS